MKQDVNYLLLGLIIVVLVGMVSMAIYAQYEYSGLNSRYSAAITQLQNKSAELENKAAEINETQSLLMERERAFIDLVRAQNLSNETAKSMTGFYQDVKGQKEILETNLNSTVAEKEKYRTSYVTATKDLQVCTETNNVKEDQLKKERAKSVSLQTKLRDASASLNKTKIQMAGINKEIRGITSSMNALGNEIKAMPDQIDSTTRTGLNHDLSDIQSSVSTLDNYLAALMTSVGDTERKMEGAA
jgi:chromosome segregation ATPase